MRDLNQQDDRNSYIEGLISLPRGFEAYLQEATEKAQALGKAFMSLGNWEAQLVSQFLAWNHCKKVVEIGTLTGRSALWMASGLAPGGQIWTFELDADLATWSQDLFSRWQQESLRTEPNFQKSIQVVQGDAVQTLRTIEDQGPFDAIFIDGNKAAYPLYLDWAEKNLKPGGWVLGDNAFLGGSVFTGKDSTGFSEKQIRAMQNFNQRLFNRESFQATMIPTAEGLVIAQKI